MSPCPRVSLFRPSPRPRVTVSPRHRFPASPFPRVSLFSPRVSSPGTHHSIFSFTRAARNVSGAKFCGSFFPDFPSLGNYQHGEPAWAQIAIKRWRDCKKLQKGSYVIHYRCRESGQWLQCLCAGPSGLCRRRPHSTKHWNSTTLPPIVRRESMSLSGGRCPMNMMPPATESS